MCRTILQRTVDIFKHLYAQILIWIHKDIICVYVCVLICQLWIRLSQIIAVDIYDTRIAVTMIEDNTSVPTNCLLSGQVAWVTNTLTYMDRYIHIHTYVYSHSSNMSRFVTHFGAYQSLQSALSKASGNI